MKAIFLDIDGVLNCDATPNPRSLPYIVDKKLLTRFRKLVADSNAKVVLTSSWRIDPIGLYAARYWRVPFHAKCPDFPDAPRRDEILSWLAKHPRVDRFAVLDDEDDELNKLPLFQPSGKTGLTPEICRGVLAYLKSETDDDMRAGLVTRLAENISSVFHRNKD
jgi:HAD domain in Swiss Army Knife RNA repair proteins